MNSASESTVPMPNLASVREKLVDRRHQTVPLGGELRWDEHVRHHVDNDDRTRLAATCRAMRIGLEMCGHCTFSISLLFVVSSLAHVNPSDDGHRPRQLKRAKPTPQRAPHRRPGR
jgi:hypothetical protein